MPIMGAVNLHRPMSVRALAGLDKRVRPVVLIPINGLVSGLYAELMAAWVFLPALHGHPTSSPLVSHPCQEPVLTDGVAETNGGSPVRVHIPPYTTLWVVSSK